MKIKNLLLLVIVLLVATPNLFSQNIAINEKGDLPDTSAMLDVSSTSKGFLAPRMATSQQNAIKLPATGLLVFNTTTSTFNVNKGTPSAPNWIPLSFDGGTVSNTLSSSVNTITSTVSGTAATAPAVNSVTNTSSVNNLTTKVNGIAASAVPMINTNVITLSGTKITSTVNGVATTALDIAPAITSNTWGLTGNNGLTAGTNFIGTTNAVDLVAKTNNVERLRITSAGNVGIGVTNPSNALHVVSTANPLLLSGVQLGAITDSVLTINRTTGVVRYLSPARFTGSTPGSGSPASGWSLTGNSGTSTSSYIGTIDQQPLILKVHGLEAGYLGVSGESNITSYGVNSKAIFGSTAIGANAKANTNNEAIALGYNTKAQGYRSIAIGSGAAAGNTGDAIAIGAGAKSNTYQGIAIGANSTTSGNNNTIAFGVSSNASGYLAMAMGNAANASGQNGTAIGSGANASGANATAVGTGANASGSNATAIGNGALASNANSISLGNSSVTSIRGQVNFTTFSDGRFKQNIKADVPGLNFILKLRPVTYNWDIHKFNAHDAGGEYKIINAGYAGNGDEEAIRKKESITYTGFIAQEVEEAAKLNHFNFSGVQKPLDDKDAYSLSYAEFVVPLVKAVQELNQKNESLTNKMNTQQETIELLLKELKDLKSTIK